VNADLDLAERIASTAAGLGISTALIGAAALAVHRYIRGTRDVDLGTVVNPRVELRALEDALTALGLTVQLNMPDEDDHLGGVLRVWEQEDEDGDAINPVEIVNFSNPYRPRATPAAAAIANAKPLRTDRALRCVQIPDLIALKLYAGSFVDRADIVQLLANNPDADLDAIRRVASPFDHTNVLEQLIAEAAHTRPR
jgi:hypothetical protein